VANTLEACGPLADSPLSATVFFELLGFRAADPAGVVAAARDRLAALPSANRLQWAIAPHAPYSVSPNLFRAIAAAAAGRPLSVHLGESPEEIRFLRDGRGPWRDLLERIGAWSSEWVAPGCGCVEYMQRLGILTDRLIAVHGVQFNDGELQQLASCGATVVTCPRSNRWTGAGVPPISRFYRSGVRVALGTDSLASVEDLNLFSEMAAMRRLCPDIPAGHILKSATLEGAVALGFGRELGSI
jgi:cytosine/adenosine deaminase-related metal-dependent hydrolase